MDMAGTDLRRVILLPSAKLVPLELQTEFGPVPPAMVPLGGRPAFTHIVQPWLDQGWAALLALNERAGMVQDYLADTPVPGLSTIDVGRTGSLALTVLTALDSLSPLPDELIVNFADTVVRDPLPAGTVVAMAHTRNLYRWTCFQPDGAGGIHHIVDRFQPKAADLPVFVGVFRFDRVAAFRADLAAAVAAPEPGLDPFYTALRRHLDGTPPAGRHLLAVRDWWDLGHLDTYYQTKQTYWINLRFFNSLAIQRSRGLIRKESTDHKKFLNEIRWYLRLPKDIAYLSPRILDYGLDPFRPWIEMEFYGYPVLNDMYLFGDHDPGVWVQVFQAIGQALDAMAAHRLVPPDPAPLAEALAEMYVDKTLERLSRLAGDPWLDPFFTEALRVNGRLVPGLLAVQRDLPRLARTAGLLTAGHFTIIHGDLCLSNILYDPRNCAIRLIDPRGSFGAWDIYGDPDYDLAKLCHSIAGDYDLIVNGQVTVDWTPGDFTIRPHVNARHRLVKQVFAGWLAERCGDADRARRVALIESLLFLSMPPLHKDRPQAQRAFLCTGLLKFAEAAGLTHVDQEQPA